jgi:hypothetical protein
VGHWLKKIMVTIRTRTFESNDTADIAFSRIDWKVEKVKRLINPMLSNSTIDTVKPWVGIIDREKREFKITKTAPFFSPRIFEGNFFQIYIHGQVFDEGQKSKVSLRFKPGLHTTFLFTAIYLFPILMIVTTLRRDNDWIGILLGLLIPLVFTLLLVLQLKLAENKLIELFKI